jgi:hypothetical protein
MEGDMNLRHTLVFGGLVLTLGLALGGQALAKPTSSMATTPDLVQRWIQRQTPPAPDLIERYVSRQPAASFYTAAALKADGLRMQAMARTYERQSTNAGSSSNGFDVRDALLGGAVGLVVAICVMGLVFVARGGRPQVAL